MTHNAVKGDEDAPKESPVLRTALMWLIIAAVIISIGNFIIFRVIKL